MFLSDEDSESAQDFTQICRMSAKICLYRLWEHFRVNKITQPHQHRKMIIHSEVRGGLLVVVEVMLFCRKRVHTIFGQDKISNPNKIFLCGKICVIITCDFWCANISALFLFSTTAQICGNTSQTKTPRTIFRGLAVMVFALYYPDYADIYVPAAAPFGDETDRKFLL